MVPLIIALSMAAIIIFSVEYITCGDVSSLCKRIMKFRPKTPKSLQPHVKRIQKMEKDAKSALEAIQNLHETKKRINADYRKDWDNQFRLLLPPPETPNRQAVRFSYLGSKKRAYRTPQMAWTEEKYILVEPEHTPVPVGAIRRGNRWWYGFNNLPGHAHEMFFIPTDEFDYVENNRFWAFLPTIRETHEGYVWEDKKAKVLTSNIFEEVKQRITS